MNNIVTRSLAAVIMIFAFTTANSQEVIELKQPQSNKIIIKLMFRNGSISDPIGKEGLTNATANLVVQGGTGSLTNRQIKELLFPMAAGYGVSVDKEVTVFTFSVHKDFLNKFYPVLKDIMLTPSFTEEDLKRVKSNQQNYVDQVIRASSDEEYSKMALEDLLFRGTNYQHMVQGTVPGVNAIILQDIKDHYKNYFTRNNLMVGIAGNYSPAFLQKLKLDMHMLSGAQPVLPKPAAAITPDGLQVEIISKPQALGSAIFTGVPLSITRADDDFAALMVANSYLGEHRNSKGQLYNKIRSVRSMNYGDYSYIEWYQSGGNNMLPEPGVPRSSNYFALWLRPVQIGEGLKKQYAELKDITIGHAQFALRLALGEIDNLIHDGMSAKAFNRTRDFLRSYIKLYIQTPDKQLGFLMDSRFYGRKDYIHDMDALLGKLTVEDVNKAIRKYWQVQNMFVTIVTDHTEAEPLAQALRNNQVSPMSYSNFVKEELPKDVLAEDENIAKYHLNIKSVKVVDTQNTFK